MGALYVKRAEFFFYHVYKTGNIVVLLVIQGHILETKNKIKKRITVNILEKCQICAGK